ncbi:MAG: hypothetical protein KAR06_08050 [Deltaproteobacteria bacterium]|nr:hypothetical protein [Deltaproteobacteria bacterium]
MLVNMNLEQLGKTDLRHLFDEARAMVERSLIEDKDVGGKREINIKLGFERTETGHISISMACSTKTPTRALKSLGTLNEAGHLAIDTVSNDARQPDLLDEGAGAPEETPQHATGGEQ